MHTTGTVSVIDNDQVVVIDNCQIVLRQRGSERRRIKQEEKQQQKQKKKTKTENDVAKDKAMTAENVAKRIEVRNKKSKASFQPEETQLKTSKSRAKE